jgi:Cytochrome c552/Cytochrome c554 and c-prime
MKRLRVSRTLIRRTAWLLGLLPFAGAVHEIQAQVGRQVVFNDPSLRPSHHDLGDATYVGYQVCAGCHGRLTSTRPRSTIIQEWDSPATNGHANDAAALFPDRIPGGFNVYAAKILDGEMVNGIKSCAVCHTTGAPKFNEPQVGQKHGYDPSQPWNDYHHNVLFLRVQCENCHGPGSRHVLSGGNPLFINRVPDAKETCWNCHVHAPNEKGNTLVAAATDEQISKYTSSLGHSHNAGALIAGTGGYEYAGEVYDEGHNFPHTKISNSCVTCHLPRDRRSPILDHSNPDPKIAACRSCHSDAASVAKLDDWQYMNNRQQTVQNLLLRLGGADAQGNPDFNASGGLLGNAADKNSLEYRRARWNYSLVINDGSLGVHNYDYAVELLTSSIAHAPAQAPPKPQQ